MSIVSVWTSSKPRVEVRTAAQAIGETGRRMSDIVLLPSQAAILAQPSVPRLFLTGPMGSGKTLLLQLKGCQWVREGRRVVVMNIRTTVRGRSVGHVLERAVLHAAEGHPRAGRVDRVDLAFSEFCADTLKKQLASSGPVDNVCFLIDELLCEMSVITSQLQEQFPESPIWCVAAYATHVPRTFQRVQLKAVLRSPPSVQLMLKELDMNPDHRNMYTTRSAIRGLPCDGPPVIFIEHSSHNTVVRHLDCSQCADELADIFENKLGLKLRPPHSEGWVAENASGMKEADSCEAELAASRSKSAGVTQSQSASRPKSAEAAPLSFRDVLILSALPMATYKYVANYYWKPSMQEALNFMIYMGKCKFLARLRQRGVPIRVAVDNSLKEIVFPPKDEAVVIDCMGAHSLERKVVIFLRGGPALTQVEMEESLSRYPTEQIKAQQEAKHSGETALNEQILSESNDMERQLLFFASLMYEIRDMLYPDLPSFPDPQNNLKTILSSLFGNVIRALAQSPSAKGSILHNHLSQERPSESPQELRLGLEIRGKMPMIQTHPALAADDRQESPLVMKGKCEEIVEADSLFLVPEALEEAEERRTEAKRIRQAMKNLSEDDKDWDFFAASRCTSQYISILP